MTATSNHDGPHCSEQDGVRSDPRFAREEKHPPCCCCCFSPCDPEGERDSHITHFQISSRSSFSLSLLALSTESSMSAKLVKGHWSVRLPRLFASYLCICSCIVFLSSHSQLTCPVLRVDSRFSHFSPRPVFSIALHDFHVFYVGKREEEEEEGEGEDDDDDERKKKSVCTSVCCRLFAQLCLLVLMRNVFIFVFIVET